MQAIEHVAMAALAGAIGSWAWERRRRCRAEAEVERLRQPIEPAQLDGRGLRRLVSALDSTLTAIEDLPEVRQSGRCLRVVP